MRITWPIIVLSPQNNFFHLAGSLDALQTHLFGDAQRNQTGGTTLQYYDSDGRLLEPVLSQSPLSLPIAFHITGYTIDEDMLLERLKGAVAASQAYATAHGETRTLSTILEDDKTVETYAMALLNDPGYAGGPQDSAMRFGPGGWLHNAIHAAFG